MSPTPRKIIKIRITDIFSVIPNSPNAVVRIKIHGPTSAKALFKTNAFSILLNFRIAIATEISIIPERTRNIDIPKMVLSKTLNTSPAPFQLIPNLLYAEY